MLRTTKTCVPFDLAHHDKSPQPGPHFLDVFRFGCHFEVVYIHVEKWSIFGVPINVKVVILAG